MLQRRLDAVKEIGTALGSTLNLDRVLGLIIEKICLLMDAERAAVFLLDEARGELWTRIAGIEDVVRLGIGEGLAGWVAKTGQRLNVKDAYKDARFTGELDRRTGFRTTSLLCQPIRNPRRKIIGVVQVLNKRAGYFTLDDEALLTAIAGHAAVTIESNKLYLDVVHRNMQLEEARDALQRRVDEIDLLYRVEQEMNRAVGLETFLGFLLRHVLATLPSELAVLALSQGNRLRTYTLVEDKRSDAGAVEPTVTDITPGGLLGTTVATGVSRVTSDFRAEPLEAELVPLLASAPSSALVVPLELNGERLGALLLCNRRSPTFDAAEELKVLTLLAGRAEAAVVLHRDREELLKAERLAAIGRALSGVVHDLKNPMTVIGGYSQLMVEAEEKTLRQRYADGVKKQLLTLKSMSQEVLSFARGDSSLLLRKVFVSDFLRELEESLRPEFEGGPALELIPAYGGAVRMDTGKMTRVALNLARNAREALDAARPSRGDPGKFVLRADHDAGRQEVIFTFQDDGPGIPETIRDHLFDPFVTSGKRDGTGLGLAIVKKIVEEHRGTVEVDSTPGSGTTFRIRLPAEAPATRPPAAP